jgi:2-oxoisovalerate dehydrogenase E1 component
MADPSSDRKRRLELHRRVATIRGFESRASALYRDGRIPGFLHLCLGQEAAAVGACWPLRPDDVITSNHRGHGHCLAKGLRPEPMFAELMARESGVNRGRAGSMHIADPSRGIFGANGIVGAGLPIAAGAALAAQLSGTDRVVVSFFGDGAVAQGAFHEALNLAAVWRLPLILFCENNHYSEFSPAADQHPAPLSARAAGYGVPFVSLDGNDVVAVADAMTDVVARVRAGGGPVVVEADTYRWHGHYEGDPERYRDEREVRRWRTERDPLAISRAGLDDEIAANEVEAEVERLLSAAVERALAGDEPPPSTLHHHVTADRPVIPEPAPADGEPFRMMDAIREALTAELEDDPRVLLAGVDVGAGGNVFALTRGLHERWPDRVRDTPISETAVVGLGVGAAMAGLRPVVEIMYLDFIGVCLDQIMNQAAKLRFMSGGIAEMGLTIRTQFGAGRSSGSQHSQSLEALLAHIPGLTVVMPSNPADAYGLLRASIQDPNPVVFIENRLTYGLKGPRPPRDHLVPLGRAAVAREGTDLTVVSVSRMVNDCLAAAAQAAEEGVSVEVVDLRTVAPLDRETVLASLAKTNKLLVAHEASRDFGIGAEIAALCVDEGFWHLDAPVRRIAPPPVPAPYAPSLERVWLPGRDRILAEIRDLARF